MCIHRVFFRKIFGFLNKIDYFHQMVETKSTRYRKKNNLV